MRSIRKSRSWTLEQTASESRLDLAHLQRIEAGQVNVTLGTLVRLAAALDVRLSSFFP